MNFEQKASSLTRTVEGALQQLDALQSQLREAAKKTEELLAIASEVGVTALSIGKKHPLVGNEAWSFGYAGSIFTPKENEHEGWPAAWHIARVAGISGGAGNGGQHQVDATNLIDGVYECRGGEWFRVDVEPTR